MITERVISLLEKGVVPWQKPWNGAELAPQNLVSRKLYRGVNVFLLHAMHYTSPFWLTFKQAQELGGHVRKGEKACPVVFWKWLDVERDGEKERVPFLRYYSVFNAAQCEGIEAHIPSVPGATREHSPVAAAQAIVDAMPKRPEIRLGLDRAFYSPGGDYVGMPNPGQFRSAEDWHSVLFHELTHSSGAECRLNRKGVTGSDGQWSAFGSNPYAKEELVAEMGAAFLCGQAGIVERTIDNSAAYVASWLARLKDDAKLVVQAAAQAQKAADFILGVNHAEQAGEVTGEGSAQ
jgi:antirestriction protein ArdC